MTKTAVARVCLTCLCLFSLSTYASDWKVGGFLESVAITPEIALREGVEDVAYGLGGEASYSPEGWFEASMGLGLIFYDDNASFSQTVQGAGIFNSGDISTESSDAQGILYFVEAGPKYSFIDDTLLGFAKVGVSGLSSDRSIPNCSDCYEENIDIDAGMYLQLGIAYQFETWELLLKYNSYTGDEGLDNVVRVGFRTR